MSVFKQDGGSNKEWGEISTFGRTWLFVTEQIPVNTFQCTFDIMSCRIYEEGEADNSGGIELTFEELDFVASQLDEVSGDITVSMQEPTASWTGTIVGITADLELNFVEPILGMQAGLGVSCTFEPFEILMQEAVIMADMNVLFKEPDGYATGRHTFISMDLRFKEFDGVMTPGLAISMEFEDLTLSMSGKSGKVANLNLRADPFTGLFNGGPVPYIDGVMKEMELVVTGSNKAVTALSLTFRKPDAVLAGQVSIMTSLNGRFNRMSLDITGSVYPVGGLSVTFQPLRASFIATPPEIDSDLDGRISLMKMMATAFVDGPNTMDLEFKPHRITATDDTGDCVLAETLTYGG
jgi:hypothetical protein